MDGIVEIGSNIYGGKTTMDACGQSAALAKTAWYPWRHRYPRIVSTAGLCPLALRAGTPALHPPALGARIAERVHGQHLLADRDQRIRQPICANCELRHSATLLDLVG